MAGGGRWIVDLVKQIILFLFFLLRTKKITVENTCKQTFDTKILF